MGLGALKHVLLFMLILGFALILGRILRTPTQNLETTQVSKIPKSSPLTGSNVPVNRQALREVQSTTETPKVSPTQAKADLTQNKTLRFSEERFRQKFPGQWKFLKSGAHVHSILDSEIRGYSSTAVDALRLARQLSPLLGVEAESIDAENIREQKTALRHIFRLRQIHRDRPVYQTEISLFFHNASGHVAMINNLLKPITKTEPGPELSISQAMGVFKSTLDSSAEAQVKILDEQGLVYFVQENTAHPAYVFYLHTDREVVVSANSGEILAVNQLQVN